MPLMCRGSGLQRISAERLTTSAASQKPERLAPPARSRGGLPTGLGHLANTGPWPPLSKTVRLRPMIISLRAVLLRSRRMRHSNAVSVAIALA